MYKILIRPVFFIFSPEKVHYFAVQVIKILHGLPFKKLFSELFFIYNNKNIETQLFGLNFKNKVGLAAGFDKNAELFNQMSFFGFGFTEIGTVTPLPQSGNTKPRLFRIPKDKAIINRMGFNNLGVNAAVNKLKNRKTNLIIGGNIGKNTATPNELALHDYVTCFNTLFDVVDYFVVNVSCPNICDLHKLQDRDSLYEILSTLQKINNSKRKRKPILLKISPDLNFAQLDDTIQVVKELHIDGIVAVNTTITRKELSISENELQQIGNGGLSGKPLQNRALEIIKYLHTQTNGQLPIIGVGGILSPEDAVNMLKAGASLVQIYTGFIYEGPALVKKINKAISEYYANNMV